MTYKDDYGETRKAVLWSAPRVFVAILATVLFVFLLTVAVTPLTLGFQWLGAATQVISPANVRAQYRLAYDDYNALNKLKDTMCIQVTAVTTETDPDAKSQRRTQLLAYEAQYNRVAGEYEARYEDAFRSKHVGPGDLPRTVDRASTVVATCG